MQCVSEHYVFYVLHFREHAEDVTNCRSEQWGLTLFQAQVGVAKTGGSCTVEVFTD